MVDPHVLGDLAAFAARGSFHRNEYVANRAIALVRAAWPDIPDYERRQILCDIEIAIALDGERREGPLYCRAEWETLLADLTPPKAPFTVVYRCGKCKAEGLKLWRGVHGCNDKDGNGLLCAACLAPKTKVGDDGKASCDDFGMRTDQISGWLPAVPVDDTFWGYTSVPTADVKWWKALPTYSDVDRASLRTSPDSGDGT